jgi:hypothetical protein
MVGHGGGTRKFGGFPATICFCSAGGATCLWLKFVQTLQAPSGRLKQITFIIGYVEFFKELEVFIAEALLGMMLFLVPDVLNHVSQLRVRIRERAKTFLPREAARHPPVFIPVLYFGWIPRSSLRASLLSPDILQCPGACSGDRLLMKFVEPVLISRTRSDNAMLGFKPIRMCVWSGMQ